MSQASEAGDRLERIERLANEIGVEPVDTVRDTDIETTITRLETFVVGLLESRIEERNKREEFEEMQRTHLELWDQRIDEMAHACDILVKWFKQTRKEEFGENRVELAAKSARNILLPRVVDVNQTWTDYAITRADLIKRFEAHGDGVEMDHQTAARACERLADRWACFEERKAVKEKKGGNRRKQWHLYIDRDQVEEPLVYEYLADNTHKDGLVRQIVRDVLGTEFNGLLARQVTNGVVSGSEVDTPR